MSSRVLGSMIPRPPTMDLNDGAVCAPGNVHMVVWMVQRNGVEGWSKAKGPLTSHHLKIRVKETQG